ncbi:hypothetical protein F5Y16DRAFT_423236 [Xylariaceae sp. FL0255]|nr:hypothetical protein F5Y16DRAFT_423236 [Xylariaceae sp. FL0255]
MVRNAVLLAALTATASAAAFPQFPQFPQVPASFIKRQNSTGPAPPTGPSCPNSDGQSFVGPQGDSFIIQCGKDYSGGDLSASSGLTFSQCIDACDTNPECLTLAFGAHRASAVEPAAPLMCPDDDGSTYHSGSKTSAADSFVVQCGHDYVGGDIGALSAITFEGCLDACDSNSECVTVAFVDGSCYMKNIMGDYNEDDSVWGASKVSAVETTPYSGPSCDDNKDDQTTFVSNAHNQYEILCATDYAGGDLSALNTDNFEDCINACDNTDGCIDVSYVAPSCYMKSTLGTPSYPGYVWTAKLIETD